MGARSAAAPSPPASPGDRLADVTVRPSSRYLRTPLPLPAPPARRTALALAVLVLVAAVVVLIYARQGGPDVVGPPVSVPDTAYDIPSDAVFMAPDGDDDAGGTRSAPVGSLGRALALVPSGGTVVMRGGTYREGSSSAITKSVTLQPYPHEQVWFDGTDVVTGWSSSGDGRWVLEDWSTPSFCNGDYYEVPYDEQREDNSGPCSHLDMILNPDNPAAGDPQMLYVDGVAVRQVPTLEQVEGRSFFYDQQERRVYLGVNPEDRIVEMAARPMALRLEGGDGGSVVRGLGFRRYATNEYNGNATHGAVLSAQPGNVYERNTFTQMAGAGMTVSDARDVVVRGNRFVENGFNGLDANGSSTSGGEDDIVIEQNLFDGNNTEAFGVGCEASCAAAGAKFAHMTGLTVRDNVFSDTREGTGFWCDLDCSQAVITGNVFEGNDSSGLYYEVSKNGIIADNLMLGNGDYGLKSGSADMEIYHNTFVDNGTDVLLYDDDRSPGVDGWSDVGPDTWDNDFFNNVLVGGAPPLAAWRTSSRGDNTGPEDFIDDMDYNAYARPSGDAEVLVEWREQDSELFTDLDDFHDATGHEEHGLELTQDSGPAFVDRRAGNYRIRSSSPAHSSGRPLPEDVADALGLEAGTVHDRGALTTADATART